MTVTIRSIVGALTEAIAAETALDSARSLLRQADAAGLDVTLPQARVDDAEAAHTAAFFTLANGIADAPECQTLNAIISGALMAKDNRDRRDAIAATAATAD